MRWRRGSRRQQVDVVVVGAGFAGLAAADRLVASGLDVLVLEEADRVETRRLARGYGGLLSNEVSSRVAPRIGVSEATVRRHGSRSMRALAAAAPRKFGRDE